MFIICVLVTKFQSIIQVLNNSGFKLNYQSSVQWKWQSLNRVRLFVTPWTVACQAPLSLWLFRQEYWSGLPCSPPGHLPTQGLNPCLLCLLQCRQILFHWATRDYLKISMREQCSFKILYRAVLEIHSLRLRSSATWLWITLLFSIIINYW